MIMPFGQYKDDDMEDVPASYLIFIYGMDWIDKWPAVKSYIEMHKAAIEKQITDGNGEV
jgi:hypothetical protein